LPHAESWRTLKMEGDMRRRTMTIAGTATLALLAAALGGCASSRTTGHATPRLATERSLVIAPQLPGEDETYYAAIPWEEGRNDDRLGIGRRSGLEEIRIIRERTFDWRSTVNGRVHENSRTYSRTIRRGVMY
jgi:hypothetical protein